MRGADHALSEDSDQKGYTSIVTRWLGEMIMGARTAEYPYYRRIIPESLVQR